MAEELELEGEIYISSKRASELSGYAQDYVGQLARKGSIAAKRVGGLWYIQKSSLESHKQKAENFKPEPPKQRAAVQESDTSVSFDGRQYLSAALAGRNTGYHPDYVAQLARAGKVPSKQIGNRWFVDAEAIDEHKREKDALLGAVQAESVGVQSEEASERESEPFYKYAKDERDQFPLQNTQAKVETKYVAQSGVSENENWHRLGVRVEKRGEPDSNYILNDTTKKSGMSNDYSVFQEYNPPRKVKAARAVRVGIWAVSITAFCVIIALVVAFAGLKPTGRVVKEYGAKLAEFVEAHMGRELQYQGK